MYSDTPQPDGETKPVQTQPPAQQQPYAYGYPPQQPVYYPPYPGVRPENPRAVAVGILNLVFAFPYLALTVFSLLGASSLTSSLGLSSGYKMDFSTILNLAGMGLGGLLLLIGGANLLGRHASGKALTQWGSWILIAVMTFNTVYTLTSVGSSYMGTALLSTLIVAALLLVYPITAAIVINRTPAELGLD